MATIQSSIESMKSFPESGDDVRTLAEWATYAQEQWDNVTELVMDKTVDARSSKLSAKHDELNDLQILI